MRVRFVGGPWHNRVVETGNSNEILSPYFVAAPPPADLNMIGLDLMVALEPVSMFTRESYHLKQFRTQYGTKYVQYIHESLIANNGKPDTCTHKERFKPWNLAMRSH